MQFISKTIMSKYRYSENYNESTAKRVGLISLGN
jgi:hypothetical protein